MKAEYLIGYVILIALSAGGFLFARNSETGVSELSGPLAAAINESQASATSSAKRFLSENQKMSLYKKSPELVAPNGYINTNGKPITIEEFKGKKVVLLDIWTYTCINCQRTFPYLRAWYETYSSEGLEIIGIHTPEFAFERDINNVSDAVKKFGLKYPVVLDNEYKTWNALGNQFWPRKYLVDIDGYIVYDHAGEGNYAETESEIRKALAERDSRLGTTASSMAESKPQGVIEVKSGGVRSPEIYFGAARNEYLGNGAQGSIGVQKLSLPGKVSDNTLYLGGSWNIQKEYSENNENGTRIVFKYSAKNVYFVASADKPVTVTVLRDGVPITDERGVDVDSTGRVTIGENRLYHLIGGKDYGEHTIEIKIDGVGLQAYTFTFG